MRLWHYKLIPYLPKSQLLAQWRELNSIFKNQPKHILINYVYEYPKNDLKEYACIVIEEMKKRGFKIKNMANFEAYFGSKLLPAPIDGKLFRYHHDKRYLLQCFYNLQEKLDRGQEDFNLNTYTKLIEFMRANYMGYSLGFKEV